MEIKQPILGGIALLAAMTLSLLLIGSFSAQTFGTWISFYANICVPVQVVLSLILRCEYPPFVRRLPQPAKGIALLAMMLAVAAAISGLVFFLVGRGVAPPTPMVMVYIIFVVVTTFWFSVIWELWPISVWTKKPSAIAAGALLVAYLVGYLIFRNFFNFSFLAGAPFYQASLDPGGTFDANSALSFSVTTVAVLFVCILFDFWPITRLPGLHRQPWKGLVVSCHVLVIASVLWCAGVMGAGIDPVRFLVNGSVSLLFGCIVILMLCQGKPFENLPQPASGMARLALAVVLAFVLPCIYRMLMPWVSGNLPSGPDAGYQAENWLAASLLGITFPMMVTIAEFFQFWPLRGRQSLLARDPEHVAQHH